MPDDTKALSQPMWFIISEVYVVFIWEYFHSSVNDELLPYFQGVNGLMEKG